MNQPPADNAATYSCSGGGASMRVVHAFIDPPWYVWLALAGLLVSLTYRVLADSTGL